MKMMKALKNMNMNNLNSKVIFSFLVLLALSCTRDEEVLPEATFPNTAEIFTDNPVGLTDQFFRSFDPGVGANTDGFGTDDDVAFEGTSSIRIDVPSATNENGTFIGGIFEDRGDGRNLTEYDALTFYARGSTTATIGLVGFGTDFVENRYATSLENIQLSTDWKKYIIPIPDPAKLTQEKGLFIFSAGSASTGGVGYTFWIDELKFETLGTLAQSRPRILGGIDLEVQAFVGIETQITGLTHTFNSAMDGDITVTSAPAYYDFVSSNPSVVSVTEEGNVSVIGMGDAAITAQVGGVNALGSIDFDVSLEPNSIVSLFSDFFPNIAVSRYNSFFEPFQTTLGGVIQEDGNSIIRYTDLNFVGIVFNDVIFPNEAVPTVDATNLDVLHIDIRAQEEVQASDFLRLELTNYGSGGETGGAFTISGSELQNGNFVEFDIPLDDFAGLTDRSELGLLLFVSDGTISDIDLDNIYFYAE